MPELKDETPGFDPERDTHIAPVGEKPIDWRKLPDDSADDDAEIETPADIVKILGFDPAREKQRTSRHATL
jgi:hypothetical protein